MTNEFEKWREEELMSAIDNGHDSIVRTLLAAGRNYTPDETDPLLHVAVRRNRLAPVDQLLDRGANINEIEPQRKSTALGIAVFQRNVEMVRLLLSRGANSDLPCRPGGETPLLHLLVNKEFDDVEAIVEILISAGADTNIQTASGWSPLMCAAYYDRPRTAQLLIKHGANLNTTLTNGSTALQIAATRGNIEIVRMLLDNSADPNATTVHGSCPLREAKVRGYSEISNLLQAAGAVKPVSISHPLAMAVFWGEIETAKDLIAAGADVRAAGTGGWTILMTAADVSAELVSLLLEHGAEVGAQTDAGADALSSAIDAGRPDCVSILAAHGADINRRYDRWQTRTPLLQAVMNNDVALVKVLIEAGADLEAPDDDRATALLCACSQGSLELVKQLLAAGANPFAVDRHKQTTIEHASGALARSIEYHYKDVPEKQAVLEQLLKTGIVKHGNSDLWKRTLALAARGGRHQTVRLLLADGADPNIVDDFGSTPLSEAIRHGHFELFRLLVDAGGTTSNVANPLLLAARSGNSNMVQYFLDAGYDANTIAEGGRTSPLEAAVGSRDVESVAILLKAGAALSRPRNKKHFGTVFDAATIATDGNDVLVIRLLLAAGERPGKFMVEAAIRGRTDLICWLLDRGVAIDATDASGRTALTAAAMECGLNSDIALNLDLVDLLLKRGADVNHITADGATALSLVEFMPAVTRKLLAAGAGPNAAFGDTALMKAVRLGDTESVSILLAAGAEVNVTNQEGDTAWRMAMGQGFDTIAALLRDHGAFEPAGTVEDLHRAILWRKTVAAIDLIKAGANVEAPNHEGLSPLLAEVIAGGDIDVVTTLLQHGANSMAASGSVFWPNAFNQAVSGNRIDIVRIMIKYGADPNGTREDNPPIVFAESVDMVRFLLSAGASPDVRHNGPHPGYTLLQQAAETGNLEVIVTLLDNGAQIDMLSNSIYQGNQTALGVAVDALQIGAMRLLLDRGATIDACEEGMSTPLMDICNFSTIRNMDDDNPVSPEVEAAAKLEIAQILLQHGASVSASNRIGATALLLACLYHGPSENVDNSFRYDLVKLLISAGSDCNVENNGGETPLRQARLARDESLVQILLAAGARR